MNHIPQFPSNPVTKQIVIPNTLTSSAVNVNANSNLLYTVPTDGRGTLFSNVIINVAGTSAACVVRFFLNNGLDFNVQANNVLYFEYAIPAVTASATVIAHRQQQVLDILLPPKFRVYVNLSANSTNSVLVTGSFLEY